MNQVRQMVAILTVLLAIIACNRSALLVGNPIELTQSPIVVRFDKPVQATGPVWEMCFEFDRPRDSHRADGIYAVLLATSGQRRPLVDATLDRRGESLVCQVGRINAYEPGSRIVPQDREVFEAVELSSAIHLRLRKIRGGSIVTRADLP